MTEFKDEKTTVQEMKDLIFQFAKDRDWIHYHTPKNLSMALTVEAGELMEHFMWLNDKEVDELKNTEKINDVRDELADIVTYALEIANVMNIDLAESIQKKYKKNCLKYPEEECQKVFEKK
ncbi:MAG: NTP pyrophosphohydrolase [Planctomycetota bacterium]|nr:MAG: NTP pyrophosphohydrolase [Planctomycetota bacterium]